ncbi:transglycosylase SLT domain-containing protein [Acinetobacter dispersus]|uniref:transglycosylase SLT domain-containing protein n=1 Tax=Acinetobacter dispersus TaxID=70348 RepID=UPI001F4B74D6|nr:transglycosylase SLT domain-containing protein [Acinetobacter dispersus]MCH7392420.1 transglycosylase SLT domain-containing protein [Acinetobacter dispersus]
MRVPEFKPQVNEAQAPSVQVRGGLTPGEAVNAVGNQLDALTSFVGAGAQAANQFQDESDRIRVMDAENQLFELKNHLQTNDIDGFNNKKGANVVGFDDGQGGGFVDYYSRAYQDGVSEITAKLGNNNQRQMFNQIASRDGQAFKSNLQNYFVRENDTYQKSVYSASADRYVRNINENPANFALIDEDRLNLKAAINKTMQLDGKSALEAENVYLSTISQAHIGNINSFIENSDLRGAVQYRDKYKDEISLNDSFKANKQIQQKLEEKEVDTLVNMASYGTEENSNFALNLPPQAAKQAINELQNLTPSEMKNIKYNDERLDIYTVQAAKDKGMEWAVPLLLGIRLAGERSNNSQVSPKGAKSVMQFMPATWGEFSKNGQRDLNNPAHTIDAALEFVDWISKKYNTKDPMVISAYYNGGANAAAAVKSGKQVPYSETRAYLERMDGWLSNGFGQYASQPGRSRDQAFEAVWKSGASSEVKGKAQTRLNQMFAAQDKIKDEQQDQAYNALYSGMISGKVTFDQLPVNTVSVLKPNQVESLRSVSKSLYEKDVKTDPTVYSMIMLNKEELFKGKPKSVLHQYADKLSPSDYKEATKVYIDVNNPKETDKSKDKKFLATDSTIASALKPYLNIIGITDTKNKDQLLHYNAVKSDLMQTILEAEARNGGHLTWDQINRLTLKNINNKVQITTSRPFLDDKVELNRVYAQVKNKGDMTDSMKKKIDDIFKKQGRNLGTVTDSEYLNAYYAMMRRGF